MVDKEIIAKLVPTQEAVNEDTNIAIKFSDNTYDGEIEIVATEVVEGQAFNFVATEMEGFKSCVFDITTKINGEKVQPNGKVLVGIPLPEGYNPDMTAVYFVEDDGSAMEEIESFVEDGMIWFETDHFSSYAVVDKSQNDCDHLCHKSGFAGFIWKIVRFFWKLFKMHPVCECGAAHY